MKKTKQFTVAEYKRGGGTKRQRTQFEKVMRHAMQYIPDRVTTIDNAAKALAQATGVAIDPDDDLPSLIDRIRDDPRAAPILALLGVIERALSTVRDMQQIPSKIGSKGGSEKSKQDKTSKGLTEKQARRKRMFYTLVNSGHSHAEALNAMQKAEARDPSAKKDKVVITINALRQSLKAAGVSVSTSERRGRRPK
jgi:hypothetical protein